MLRAVILIVAPILYVASLALPAIAMNYPTQRNPDDGWMVVLTGIFLVFRCPAVLANLCMLGAYVTVASKHFKTAAVMGVSGLVLAATTSMIYAPEAAPYRAGNAHMTADFGAMRITGLLPGFYLWSGTVVVLALGPIVLLLRE